MTGDESGISPLFVERTQNTTPLETTNRLFSIENCDGQWSKCSRYKLQQRLHVLKCDTCNKLRRATIVAFA